MTNIAIIDYGSGNLHSVAKAFECIAQGNEKIVVTADAKIVRDADRIVLPGVGAFGDCARGLAALPDMPDALDHAVKKRAVPFFGICVGMQLLAERGFEHGEHKGLGWIAGDVVALEPSDPALKIPHMGWNELQITQPHALVKNIAPGTHVYFVHSYHLRARDPQSIIAQTSHGGPIAAMVAQQNVAGTQFHPEKSQQAGLAILRNFLDWRV